MTAVCDQLPTTADAAAEERPLLTFPATVDGDEVVVDRDGVEFAIAVEGVAADALAQLLAGMDGTRTVAELAEDAGDPAVVARVVAELDRNALLDDATTPDVRSGADVLLELEDLAAELHAATMERNVLWSALRTPSPGLGPAVLHGLCVEQYHLVSGAAAAHAAVAPPPSTGIRQRLDELRARDTDREELLVLALEGAGIGRDDLADTMPLPQTMALCNGFAHWAATDPVLLFVALAILHGKDVQEAEQRAVLAACDHVGVDAAFAAPLRRHAAGAGDGQRDPARAVVRKIPSLHPATVRRLRARTHLLMELHDVWSTAVWAHYSTAPASLRRVSAL